MSRLVHVPVTLILTAIASQETKPHIMVTYNGDGFDWPFLDRRCQKNELDLCVAPLSPLLTLASGFKKSGFASTTTTNTNHDLPLTWMLSGGT